MTYRFFTKKIEQAGSKKTKKIINFWWMRMFVHSLSYDYGLSLTNSRSSHPEVFWRKSVLKICSKVTGEHPCQSVISIKLLFSFIEIALWDWYSSVICCIFSEHLFLKTPLGSCFWCSYLKNRNQLIQTNNNFSSSKKFHARVPQS